jgi:signal transduction histidine kinase
VVSTSKASDLRSHPSPAIASGDRFATAVGDEWPGTDLAPHRRWSRRRSKHRATQWLVFAVVIIGCVAALADGLLATGTQDSGLAWMRGGIVAGLIGAGALAFTIQERHRMGTLLLGGGLASALWMLNGAADPFAFSVGVLFTGLGPWLCAYLSLAYPTGHLRSVWERRFLAFVGWGSMLWLLAVLTQAQPPIRTPLIRCPSHCPRGEFFTGITLGAAAPVLHALLVAGWLLITCGTALLIARRARSAPTPVRRSLSPIELVAAANALVLLLFIVARTAGSSLAGPIGSVYAALVLVIPFAMLLGLALERLFMARALATFIDDLARLPQADPQSLMAAALHDPSLRIAYERPGTGRFVDSAGEPVAPPCPSAGRAVTWIEQDDHPLAAISYDAELATQEPFVQAAGTAVIMRLERATLEAALEDSTSALAASHLRLKASTAELAASRARLVETAYTERRRIERDLHDSVQQDLVGLRIKLDLIAETVTDDPHTGARMIASLGTQMDHMLEALRSLARGIYPVVLTETGLGEALKSAARRCPAPVTVTARGIGRYHQDIEVAVYFCCLEALQNIVKHAGPGVTASIRMRQLGDQFIVDVRDTGAGFDPGKVVDGHGLRNMRDRIEAVGGKLIISARTPGTSIRAIIPTA